MSENPMIPIDTRVHVRSPHFREECDGVIREAVFDDGWLYRIEVLAGQEPEAARKKDGSVWVWDFEAKPVS